MPRYARKKADTGGAEGDRTPDLVIANDALSQLSYGPVPVHFTDRRETPAVRASGPLSEAGTRLEAQFSQAALRCYWDLTPGGDAAAAEVTAEDATVDEATVVPGAGTP